LNNIAKKFKDILINKGYLIAIDGTGKISRDRKWLIMYAFCNIS